MKSSSLRIVQQKAEGKHAVYLAGKVMYQNISASL